MSKELKSKFLILKTDVENNDLKYIVSTEGEGRNNEFAYSLNISQNEIKRIGDELKDIWNDFWKNKSISQINDFFALFRQKIPFPQALKFLLYDLAKNINTILLLDNQIPVLNGIPWEIIPQAFGYDTMVVIRSINTTADIETASTSKGTLPPRILFVFSLETSKAENGLYKDSNKFNSRLFPKTQSIIGTDLSTLKKSITDFQPNIIHFQGFKDKETIPNDIYDATLNLIIANNCHNDFLLNQGRIGTLRWYGNISSEYSNQFITNFYQQLSTEMSLANTLISLKNKTDKVFMPIFPITETANKEQLLIEIRSSISDEPLGTVKAENSVNQWERDLKEIGSLQSPSQPIKSLLNTNGRKRKSKKPDINQIPKTGKADKMLFKVDFHTQIEVIANIDEHICPVHIRNDRHPFTELSIEPKGNSIENVQISIHCDSGESQSTWMEFFNSIDTKTIINCGNISFPNLFDLIHRKISKRKISFRIEVTSNNKVLYLETHSCQYMGYDEWLHISSNFPFLSGYIISDSETVKSIIQQSSNTLRTLTGKQDSFFTGYQNQNPKSIDHQINSIYLTLKQLFRLNYSAPPGNYVYNDGSFQGQRVRFPDEIIKHSYGTCFDLTLLFAACVEHIALHPLVIFTTGHAFLGIWKNGDDSKQFWNNLPNKNSNFGSQWIIKANERNNLNYFLKKIKNILLIETTFICYSNESFEDSIKSEECDLPDFQMAVDVKASRPYIQPIF